MAVSNFTVKLSGTVAYTDNSHGSFEATAVWKGSLGGVTAQHSSADSLEHFRRLHADNASGVRAVLDVLTPSTDDGAIVLSGIAAPAVSKTVSSFVMEVSGLASYDDNSKTSFVAQWVNGVVNLFPAETMETWRAMGNCVDGTCGLDGASRAFLVSVFEAATGPTVGFVT
ncbi:MAG: hypothetical protein ACYS8Y_13845 [Planctomycetota bacterium]|jgi:hypothetical protein